jgi:hypothetical protein
MAQTNGPQATNISVIDPISPAIGRVKTILFDPFDLGKWFVIGFSAWLAQLGDAGGGGGGPGGGPPRGIDQDIHRQIGQAREYVFANLDWIAPLVVAGLAIFIGLWLLFVWLSSRGRFMFLYCVAQNRAEVTNPWHQFRAHANSLFAFRVVVGLITFVAAFTPFVIGGIVVVTSSATVGFNVVSVMGIVAAVMYFIAVMVVAALIGKFTKDFAVPIMYLHTNRATTAWRILLDLLSVNKGRFFLYILFQIVIGAAIGATLAIAACCTCCCKACLFALPYLGTVILLPVHVFTRSYSLYYLAQYGRELNVFEPQPGGATGP